jgi:hypothetical protein
MFQVWEEEKMNDQLMSFYYLIFQSNPNIDKIIYWKDGDKTKQTIKKQDFLKLAIQTNNGINYSDIYDACNTYSFYLWDALDNKVIHLTQKIEADKAFDYKDTVNKELNKVWKDKNYRTPTEKEKANSKLDSNFQILSNLGFETPSFEMLPELTKQINNNMSSDSIFTRVKNLFKQ